MASIDPTARIEDGATLADDVFVGPFCVVGHEVRIGAGTRLVSHVSVTGRTTIGGACTIHPFAALGGPPQSLGYRGEPTELVIGDGCIIRENATMNRGTAAGGGITRVGDRGFFMNGTHVGHDCTIGNDVILAGGAILGGHCEIGDSVFVGGVTALHQFTRIGQGAMLGGMSGLQADLIPYGLASGQHARLSGLNVIGMKRRGFTATRLARVKAFYHLLFRGSGVFSDRLPDARAMAGDDPAIAEILAFIDAGRKRALCLPAVGGE